MNCLRCGRETTDQQVFCDACLDNMARHPIKGDIAVHLPVRKPREAQRMQSFWRRRDRSPEQMVLILRKRVRFLAVLSVILAMMLAAAATGVWFARQQGADLSIPNIGQNFMTSNDTTSPSGD